MNSSRVFEIERTGEVLILNLRKGIQDLTDATEILEHVRIACINNVIVDCHDIDFLRSTGLGLFVTIANRLKRGPFPICGNDDSKLAANGI